MGAQNGGTGVGSIFWISGRPVKRLIFILGGFYGKKKVQKRPKPFVFVYGIWGAQNYGTVLGSIFIRLIFLFSKGWGQEGQKSIENHQTKYYT